MRLKDKVAIVTGSASGFGKGIAIMFATEGAKVVVADINQDAGGETAATIKANRYEATFTSIDVSVPGDAAKMAKTAVDNYGKIDILVNSAGICRMCSITDLTRMSCCV